jgi:hypothetical protein
MKATSHATIFWQIAEKTGKNAETIDQSTGIHTGTAVSETPMKSKEMVSNLP